ncbi:unnamed protein product, partial [Polarella glacialis]
VVTSSGSAAPPQETINKLMDRWVAETSRARGSRAKISLEPEDWDEARLRAVCARHGWEFEWMTEEGERRRRIEGAERARKVAVKTKSSAKSEEAASRWSFTGVTSALSSSLSIGQSQARQVQGQ